MTRYPIVIEKAGSNFSAYAPDLPGCIATGTTAEEARQRMREAIELHLEGLRADGIEPPEPYSNRPGRPGTTIGRMMRYGETPEDVNNEARDILGITALEEKLSTAGAIPYPAITEQEAWLKLVSPRLYDYAPRLEAAKLLSRTDTGFDVHCSQASFVRLLSTLGVNYWKEVTRYFTCRGRRLNSDSLKNQVQTATGRPPGDWYRLTAAIPELS